MPSADPSQQPSGKHETEASICSAQPEASPKDSEQTPLPYRFWRHSSSESEGDSDGTDKSIVEHRPSTWWSSQPITSSEPSAKTDVDDDEGNEQRAIQAARARFSVALKEGTAFELTSRQFEAVSNVLEQISENAPGEVHSDAPYADSVFDMNTEPNSATAVPTNLSSRQFNRRVQFLALVGDYAGRVFNSIRFAARDLGFGDFPRRPGELRQMVQNERRNKNRDSVLDEIDNPIGGASGDTKDASANDDIISKTELVGRCIAHLASQDSAMAAVHLDVDVVLLAAAIYEQRNATFHCQIGHPSTRNNKRATRDICAEHKSKFHLYLESEQSQDPVLTARIEEIMSFYPASVDWMRHRDASQLEPTTTTTTTSSTKVSAKLPTGRNDEYS